VTLVRTDFTVRLPGDEWLVATLERPAEPRCLVLICHGLTGDMYGPGGLKHELAATLIGVGAAVLRLETRGAGDSFRSPAHPVLSGMVDDVLAVLGAPPVAGLRDLPLILCGMSLGALAAAEAARQLPVVAGVVSISSDLADGDMRPWPVRWSRAAEHSLPEHFMADLARFRPRGSLLARGIPIAAVIGGNDRGAAQADELRAEGVLVELIPGADHLFVHAAAREALFARVRSTVVRFAGLD
jgi:alpha-beta hydrolase superfamily lysophospholipase